LARTPDGEQWSLGRGRPTAVRVRFLRSRMRARAGGSRAPSARERPNERRKSHPHRLPPRVPASDGLARLREHRAAARVESESARGESFIAAEKRLASDTAVGLRVRIGTRSVAARFWRLRRPGGCGAGRRPALVWPFGVRADVSGLGRRSR